MATAQEIPFSCIPRQSALFLNYIDFAPSALRFYQNAPAIESLERMARRISSEPGYPRAEIAAILRRQNNEFGGDAACLRNIGELGKEGCVAVVTGQQVGIFANPLYTVYKALTAIHLADALVRRGIRAVPIFWMETEDHDLPEVTHRTVLDADSCVQAIDYREALFGKAGTPKGPVGSIPLPDGIRDVVGDFLSRMPDSPWKPEMRDQLESSYKPGTTFAMAFARLLSRILGGMGLILFDPHDPEAKRLTSAVFQKALCEAGTFREALLQRSRDLASAGFHSQVSILENSTVLFFLEDGARWALEKRDSGFSLKNGGRSFSLDALLECAAQKPGKFSPNVLLRPLIQDSLFPTIAYVGGSAEVAYFAQIEVLYGLVGRPMPVIWPRDSLTLIEPHIAAEMDRLRISLQDCFQERRFLMAKALRNSGLSEAASGVENLQRRMEEGLTDIRAGMQAVDPTLARALETARRKILHNIQRLKSHAIRLETNQNSLISNAADRLINHCYPNGVLQERELGIQHFWVRCGPSVLEDIRASLKTGSFAHHVLRLKNPGTRE